MHPFAYHEFKEIDVEENRSFVTKAIIKEGFVDLGIKKGDALFNLDPMSRTIKKRV